MPSKSTAAPQAVSILSIVNGFICGYAQDPAQHVLTVQLLVDGKPAALGRTGFALPAKTSTNASTNNGFCLPMPAQAMDGWPHTLAIRINEWANQTKPPQAQQQYFHGRCFGEVVHKDGYYQGWVALRYHPTPEQLPDIVVGDGTRTLFNIQPVLDPAFSIEGSRSCIKFRIPAQQLNILANPEFFCMGTRLRLHNTSAKRKLTGCIDSVGLDGIRGWVLDASRPGEAQELNLMLDGNPCGIWRPNIDRPDIAAYLKLPVEQLGICGFDIPLPIAALDGQPHTLALYCKADGTQLANSPWRYQQQAPAPDLQQLRALLGRRNHRAGFPTVLAAKTKAQVSAIILNRNGAGVLAQLFDSFARLNSVPTELIIVDHASSDNSIALIKQWSTVLPIRLLALKQNYSFSASCNRAAKLAKAPNLLFLNNDIVWLQDVLPPMLQTLQQKKTGAVGLKLLRADAGNQHSRQHEVQHLGVRFTLVDNHYWPYEVRPEHENLENLYSAVELPCVTAAVMLCRRKTFLDSGGFDEHYFYGYEDVELCLRFKEKHGLRNICRNDLVALHHHGHTRLTGKEKGMNERLLGNQRYLAATLGPWLKRHYWHSLLNADRGLSAETLTIGFAVSTRTPGMNLNELEAAYTLAEQIQAIFPHARIQFYSAEHDWYQVQGCHLLLVLSPWFDPRMLQGVRADLRLAVYLHDTDNTQHWCAHPALQDFDACLLHKNVTIENIKALQSLLPCETSTTKAPLGNLAAADKVRIGIACADSAKERKRATTLQQTLRAHGVYAQLLRAHKQYMADVVLVLAAGKNQTKQLERLQQQHLGAVLVVNPDTKAADKLASKLTQQVEKAIGRPFYTS